MLSKGDKMNKIEFWFDGCCEPKNPGGHSSYGIVVKKENLIILEESGYCGYGVNSSNNVAEYSGFNRILEYLIENKLNKEIIFGYGDSKLVIKQQFGTWQIKQGIYVPFALKAKKLMKKFKNIYLEWIPREENDICDKLSKNELLKRNVKFRIQPIK